MRVITVASNTTYKALRRLAESSRERRKLGQTLLDGPHLLAAALANGIHPDLVCCTAEVQERAEIRPLLAQVVAHGGESIQLDTPLMQELSPVETPSGIVARIAIPRLPVAGADKHWLCLEDVQDPGNLGGLLRSAAAAGVDRVVFSRGCADPWSPRALRGGMGAQFVLPMLERQDLTPALADFRGMVLATVAHGGNSLYALDLRGPVAWLVGNEGNGLSEASAALATHQVRIPLNPRIESLNVAAATAICLFERVRQCGG